VATGGKRGGLRLGGTPGFWGWAERVYSDPGKRAWFLRWFWLVSLGILAVGFTAMLLAYLGRPP
jgi:hypothetical protein